MHPADISNVRGCRKIIRPWKSTRPVHLVQTFPVGILVVPSAALTPPPLPNTPPPPKKTSPTNHLTATNTETLENSVRKAHVIARNYDLIPNHILPPPSTLFLIQAIHYSLTDDKKSDLCKLFLEAVGNDRSRVREYRSTKSYPASKDEFICVYNEGTFEYQEADLDRLLG